MLLFFLFCFVLFLFCPPDGVLRARRSPLGCPRLTGLHGKAQRLDRCALSGQSALTAK